MTELDPRWEWVEVTALGDPGPRYMRGQCNHLEIVPIETRTALEVATGSSGEVVASLCLTCDAQLPPFFEA